METVPAEFQVATMNLDLPRDSIFTLAAISAECSLNSVPGADSTP